jgi:integrase
MKLMVSNVPKLVAPATGQVIYWDDEMPGFGVRVTTGSRSYVVQGRVNGKDRRVTIAPVRLLALKAARDRAARMLLNMRDGIDPQEEKRVKKVEGVTLRQVMEDYCAHKTTKHGPLRPQTQADIERHVTVNFKVWTDRPVSEIDEAAVLKQFRELKKKGGAQAFQATSVLQSLLKWARKTNKALPDNPIECLKGERQKPKPKTGRIPNDKVGEAFAMLRARSAGYDHTSSAKTGADVVTFLLLTGARWNEAAKLTWDRVDLKGKVPSWHLTEDDAKNHNAVTFPLSTAAFELLKTRHAARDKKNPYVFPARSGGKHIIDARVTMKPVSKIAGLPITPHDIRRTFTNVAIKCGVDMFKIELLTNHVPKSITLIHYSETSDLRESCAAEIERIGTWIVAQAKTARAVAAGKNVVPLRA